MRNRQELDAIPHFADLENGWWLDKKFNFSMWSLNALLGHLTGAIQHATGKPMANINSALTLGQALRQALQMDKLS